MRFMNSEGVFLGGVSPSCMEAEGRAKLSYLQELGRLHMSCKLLPCILDWEPIGLNLGS